MKLVTCGDIRFESTIFSAIILRILSILTISSPGYTGIDACCSVSFDAGADKVGLSGIFPGCQGIAEYPFWLPGHYVLYLQYFRVQRLKHFRPGNVLYQW
jgi:hypothetical protein